MEPAAVIRANAPHALYGLAGPHLYRFTADFRDDCIVLQWIIGEDAPEDELEDYQRVGTEILSHFFDADINEQFHKVRSLAQASEINPLPI